MRKDEYKCMNEQLLEYQQATEKASLDTLNQHDKVEALMHQLFGEMNHMTLKIEALNYEMEDVVRIFLQKKMPEEMNKAVSFSELLHDQSEKLAQISQLIQEIMEEQSAENVAIHEMEQQITKQREVLEMHMNK